MSVQDLKKGARNFISKASSLVEIYISVIILIGILMLSIDVVREMISMWDHIWGSEAASHYYQIFFDYSLQLIIGVEFIKMLSKHTSESAVEVLVFVIAKRVITTSNFTSMDVLLSVVALAILFGINKYLHTNKKPELT
ncbi:hypothetical protein [Acetivibrio sp. MSJd-27]|mgnify:CR=1 FL=1|uniref:hypothetical protein n=1 Tax=Acetivibrio sp. MSJd-27 TaxID=2841523 RepID=UPI001C10A8A9|nr:hypothetical protein [Acetivibrio sp. MSJd-27]MBU5450913.1 hypothetical protein [Acetivibrio sp. MSJd-27]